MILEQKLVVLVSALQGLDTQEHFLQMGKGLVTPPVPAIMWVSLSHTIEFLNVSGKRTSSHRST